MRHQISRARAAARWAISDPRTFSWRLRYGQAEFASPPWDEIRAVLREDDCVLEAGAANGADTLRLAAIAAKGLVIAVEPLSAPYEQLAAATRSLANVRPIQVAVSTSNGVAEMLVSQVADESVGPESSTLLKPREHATFYPEVAFPTIERVWTETLDDLLGSRELPPPQFAWLDLQGMELAVLKASPRVRSSLRAVYMEVSRVELFSGAPKARDVFKVMRNWGFEVRVNRVGAVSGNALFVRGI